MHIYSYTRSYLIYIGTNVLIALDLLRKGNEVHCVHYQPLASIQSESTGHFYKDSSLYQCTYMSLDLGGFIPDSTCGIMDLRYALTSIPLQKTQK